MKVSSGTSSTMSSRRCREGDRHRQHPEGAASPCPPSDGWDRGWRSQEKTTGLHFPSPGLCDWLTFPSGVCFSLGLWMSSGWSSSLMVMP